MRYIAIVILVLAGLAHSYEVRVVNKTVEVNQFSFKGNPVWTVSERSDYLKAHRSSAPVTVGQFTPVNIPANDQAIIDDLNADGFRGSRSDAIREIARRKGAEYISNKAKLNGLGLSQSIIKKLLR